MLNQLQPNAVKYQDGSSKTTSAPVALLADELNFEQRQVEDWLRFAQEFSFLLHYYNDENELEGLWSGFLCEDIHTAESLFTIENHEVAFRNFRLLLGGFLKGELPVNVSEELHQKLQAPHRTLFLTFLKLLEEIKEQFNQLPAKHLDFHFKDLLGFETLPALPDEVHVQVTLVSDVEQIMLPTGTVLLANPNEENQISYATDHLWPLNQIQLDNILQIYLEKTIEKIADIRSNNIDDDDKGFLKLMEFALGADGIGTELQPVPVVNGLLTGSESLQEFHLILGQAVENNAENTVLSPFYEYVKENLYMTFQDFDLIMKTQKRLEDTLPSYPNAWQTVYDILRKAYLTKESVKRRKQLRASFEKESSAEDGFKAILFHAFAKDLPPAIKPYNNNEFNLENFFSDLSGINGGNSKARAINYLETEWYFKVDDFLKLRTILLSDTKEEAEWDEALILLEQAMRDSQGIGITEPQKTHIARLYNKRINLEDLAKTIGEDAQINFPFFGDNHMEEAILGWQIASPLFILSEGVREVFCYLRIKGDQITHLTDLLETSAINQSNAFLRLQWSIDEKLIPIETGGLSFGNFIVAEPLTTLTYSKITKGNETILSLASTGFDRSLHTNCLILLAAGTVYQIIEITGPQTAQISHIANFSEDELEQIQFEIDENEFALFDESGICYNTIEIHLELAVDFPALKSEVSDEWPQLQIDLNQQYQPQDNPDFEWNGIQNLLRDFMLDQVFIKVAVQELEITSLENDFTNLDSKKPYLPFGETCEYGNSFYFTHEEIASKPISKLDVKFTWPQIPENFSTYYQPYYDNLGTVNPKNENAAYKARLSLKDEYKTVLIEDGLPILSASASAREENVVSSFVSKKIQEFDPDYQYKYDPVTLGRNTLSTNRYFILEYSGASFLYDEYRLAQVPFYTKLQSSDIEGANNQPADAQKSPVAPPKPYVPKLKKLSAGYTAEQLLFKNGKLIERDIKIAYQLPFGTYPLSSISGENGYPLISPYNNSGELYLGLKDAKPGDAVSLLFQLANGTTPSNVQKPDVKWFYQSKQNWQPISVKHELLDRTVGLTQTGIKVIQLPADISNETSELPGGLLWIKAVAFNHSEGLPRFVSIITGVGHAFLQDGAPESHFDQPLEAGSITEFAEFIPEVESINQPFSSSNGKGQEKQQEFYYRVSKRLRHKNRALTMWDYEQLVLQKFPNIFKAKCLSADHLQQDSAGQVSVLVIPDVRGQVPFTPHRPELAEHELIKISEYLKSVSPPFAELLVSCPEYVEIKVRLSVKLNNGYQTDLSKIKLSDTIKEFLSPWAYDVEEEISFGGEIYANAMIGFLENLTYVDYISNIKLFESNDGKIFNEIFAEDGILKATAASQKTVLVSSQNHVLDLINEDGYVVEQFNGINFNKIELDFRVGN